MKMNIRIRVLGLAVGAIGLLASAAIAASCPYCGVSTTTGQAGERETAGGVVFRSRHLPIVGFEEAWQEPPMKDGRAGLIWGSAPNDESDGTFSKTFNISGAREYCRQIGHGSRLPDLDDVFRLRLLLGKNINKYSPFVPGTHVSVINGLSRSEGIHVESPYMPGENRFHIFYSLSGEIRIPEWRSNSPQISAICVIDPNVNLN